MNRGRSGTRAQGAEQPALDFDTAPERGSAITTGSHITDGAEPEPPVVVRRSARRKRTVTAYREAGNIVVLIPQRMSKTDEETYVPDMVAKLLARETKNRAPAGDEGLTARATELAQRYLQPKLGYSPAPTAVSWVTNQNHRWGSCTPSSGTIRLSHRIQMMPSWVVDYVLLHELAHLAEAKHSHRFWRLLDGYPSGEKARGYLEGFQAGLMHQPDSQQSEATR